MNRIQNPKQLHEALCQTFSKERGSPQYEDCACRIWRWCKARVSCNEGDRYDCGRKW
ncbi:MAG: hypothetical protein QXR55_03700 [Sulfolobales archaeon]